MTSLLARVALLVLLLPALSGCGGSVSLEWGGWDDFPPDVNLAASPTGGVAGDSVKLVAAAADESGIDEVIFYRYDGNTAVRLGSDYAAPYEWTLVLPSDGRASVTVFARAYDNAGNHNDSRLLSLSIAP